MAFDTYTKVLLHMNGTDGSTTFTDNGVTGKSWTASGSAQIDTAQSKFGGASGLFNGTTDYIITTDNAIFQLDGGSDSNEWTVDFWVRFNGDPGTGIVGLFQQYVDDDNLFGLILNNNNLMFIVQSAGVDVVSISNAWNPAGDTWYHVAIVKQGTTGYKMFIDGTQIGSTQTDTSTIPNYAGNFQIGLYYDAAGNLFNGWMDEFRLSKGVARWTANFTPPIYAYSGINLSTVSGALSSIVGANIKQAGKIVAGALSSIVGALSGSKIAFSTIGGAISSIAGALSGTSIFKVLVAGITPSGTLVIGSFRALIGGITTITSSLAKQAQKPLSGLVTTIVGSVANLPIKNLVGTISSIVGVLGTNASVIFNLITMRASDIVNKARFAKTVVNQVVFQKDGVTKIRRRP